MSRLLSCRYNAVKTFTLTNMVDKIFLLAVFDYFFVDYKSKCGLLSYSLAPSERAYRFCLQQCVTDNIKRLIFSKSCRDYTKTGLEREQGFPSLWGRWLGCGVGVRWWLLGEGLLGEGGGGGGGVNGWWVVVTVGWCEGGWVEGGGTGEYSQWFEM